MRIVVTIGAATLAGVASLTASLPASAANTSMRVSLIATTTSSMRTIKDVLPSGMSPGDVLQYTETLTSGGRDSGSDIFNLTLGRNGANTLNGYWLLAGGALHVHGTEQCCTAPYRIPVTDGSGAYRGLHGNLVISGQTETFTLTRG